jgi:flavin-dependent dehydrogenase
VAVHDDDRPHWGVEILSGRALHLLSELGAPALGSEAWAMLVPETFSAWTPGAIVASSAVGGPWGAALAVERGPFDRWLRQWALAEGARIALGVRIRSVERLRSGFRLHAHRSGEALAIDTASVVIATGRRRPWPWRRRFDRPGEIALLGEVTLTGSASIALGHALFIERLEGAWSYVIPRPTGGWFAGLCLSPQGLAVSHERPIELFGRMLACGTLASEVSSAGSVHGRPSGRAAHFPSVGPAWIAIGDAAFAADPLSGRGLEFAAESAKHAAALILNGRCTDNTRASRRRYAAWISDRTNSDALTGAGFRAGQMPLPSD